MPKHKIPPPPRTADVIAKDFKNNALHTIRLAQFNELTCSECIHSDYNLLRTRLFCRRILPGAVIEVEKSATCHHVHRK